MTVFLRTHRRRAGLTLDGLAERTGLTKSYLSKIERGLSTPSISVALKIARVLETDVGQLFSSQMDNSAMIVIRATDSPANISGPATASRYELLAPSLMGKAMQPFLVYPSAVMAPQFLDHPGEEFLMVHSGAVEFEIPGQSTRLEAGDSMYFDTDTPHRMRSLSTPGAVVLVVAYEKPSDESKHRTTLATHSPGGYGNDSGQ